MKEYTVYFEIYGKKMKVTVKAFNEAGAKLIVANELKFHKVEEQSVAKSFIKDFFDGLNKTK